MEKFKKITLIVGVIMWAYLVVALFIFLLSAGTFIFSGGPFSGPGHGMFIGIFHLPLPILLAAAGIMIYTVYFLIKNWE